MKVQISFLIDREQKEHIEKAANNLTVSLAAFIRMAARAYADKVLETSIDPAQIQGESDN